MRKDFMMIQPSELREQLQQGEKTCGVGERSLACHSWEQRAWLQ
jgi:hypothetical protein